MRYGFTELKKGLNLTASLPPSPTSPVHSPSAGLFAGLSLEGTVLVERKEANAHFYGQPIPALDLLTGKVPAPEAASALYEVIEAAEAVDESGVGQASYIPTAEGGYTATSTQQGQGQQAYGGGAGVGGASAGGEAPYEVPAGAMSTTSTAAATASTATTSGGGEKGNKTVFDADQP